MVYFAGQHELFFSSHSLIVQILVRHKSNGRLSTAPGGLWDAGGIIRFNAYKHIHTHKHTPGQVLTYLDTHIHTHTFFCHSYKSKYSHT